MSDLERDAAPAGADFVPGFGDIGARLRGARERAGLSVAQAAERLHCDRGLVEALEAGRFTQLGAPVFARGHIRRYAELLGEPVGEILEHWDREAAGHVAAPDLTRIPQAKRAPDTRRFMLPLGILAVVALFAALISWVLRDAPLPQIAGLAVTSEVPAAAAPATQTAPVAAADVPSVSVATAPGAAAAGDATIVAAAADPGAPAVSAAPVVPASSKASLRLRAQADCWVEIYGADRTRLYFGLLRGGASTTVAGEAPLRVLLGNVGGVTVEVNGRAAAVPRSLQRANTANVRVAADGSFSAVPRD